MQMHTIIINNFCDTLTKLESSKIKSIIDSLQFNENKKAELNNKITELIELDKNYKKAKNISGIIMFIDLVGSTKYKEDNPYNWEELIFKFLKRTTDFFIKDSPQHKFDLIKYIGDEVMFFHKFEPKMALPEKQKIANDIYHLIFNKNNKEYIKSINELCEPKYLAQNSEKNNMIKVKMFISVVENAKILLPYENINNTIYDLIGPDVDRAARIKEMASSNMLVSESSFINLLKDDYSNAMKKYTWQKRFKGIDEDICFYARKLYRE